MRSLVREAVFKYTYSRLFNSDNEELFDVLIKDLSEDDKDFAHKLNNRIISNYEVYLNRIQSLSTTFKLNRLYKSDLCAILIGIAEFDVYKNVTPKIVIIDEAVGLAAKFSTDNSPNFVNGILAKALED